MLFSNNWCDEECEQKVGGWTNRFSEDLADRVYTSQLIGKIPIW